ncbi:hypothetical protein PSHT_13123 [Puccinia striiformis]|uniref:Uncharacterized protein n=1 Tax=Puccinia striiformis TaxID=27350 RepID=A0A2S4USL8_9BASI|nr:hypothetical protein PSHT_13123 [Puccinia striiformis]
MMSLLIPTASLSINRISRVLLTPTTVLKLVPIQMARFERAPAIFEYTHPEGTDDGDDNPQISYKLIANSTVPTEDLINERVCSLLAPITGPLPFKLSINIIGQNDQTEIVDEIREELMSHILGSIHEVLTEQATSVSLNSFIDPSDGKNAVNLFFDPIKRPLSDSMTRQAVARMTSLNLHISIDHGHDTKITKSVLPGLLDSMDLVIHVLVSYLSQEIPLLFNSEYRSLDIVHREQTKADRMAGQLLKILLHHDYEQLIESTIAQWL